MRSVFAFATFGCSHNSCAGELPRSASSHFVMDIQAAFVFEVHFTKRTIVGSFRTVNTNVPSHFVPPLEFFSTHLALVSNCIRFVNLDVSLQFIQPCEALSTLLAFMWFFAGVNIDMPAPVKFGNFLETKRTTVIRFHD